MTAHLAARRQADVAQTAERPDSHAIAQHHLTFQHDIDIDRDIAPDRHHTALIEAARIRQSNPMQTQRMGCTLLVMPFQPRQLPWIVGPLDLDRIRADHERRRPMFTGSHGEDIGEVILALGIAIAQRRQPDAQGSHIDRHDAGIDGPHRALIRTGIAILDDRRNPSLTVANHPTVAGRIRRFAGQHRQRAGRLQQRVQRLRPDQRHITVEHQHPPVFRQPGQTLHHRMAGAQALGLLDPGDVLLPRERRPHRLPTMPEHHVDGIRSQRPSAVDDMPQHRPTCDRLQHLRQGGAHPLAFACRKHDHHQTLATRRSGTGTYRLDHRRILLDSSHHEKPRSPTGHVHKPLNWNRSLTDTMTRPAAGAKRLQPPGTITGKPHIPASCTSPRSNDHWDAAMTSMPAKPRAAARITHL